MSNQPPARPWFRLASISRPQSAPAPAPAPAATPPPAPTAPTQPRPPMIARPAFRPVAPSREPTPPPPTPPAPVTAPTPTFIPRPPAPVIEPTPVVTSRPPPPPPPPQPPTPPASLQQPTEVRPPPPAIRVPSVPSSPRLRPNAPTASLPELSTTMRPAPPSPNKELSPPQFGRRIPPPSSPARKDSSPESVKPAAQIPSQKFMPAAVPPPSLLVLPPPQVRAGETDQPKIPPVAEQQKTVLVQKTVHEKPKPMYNDPFKPSIARNGKQDISRAMEGKDKPKRSAKKYTDSEDGLGTTIITIAGDNTGAVMDIVPSPKKHGFTGKPHFLFDKVGNVGHKMLSDGSESESSSSEGESSKSKKDKNQKANNTKLPMNAYTNSNVQGINNSVVYNSSCSDHDPGVHLALTKKPADGGFVIKERANVYHSD